MQDRKIGYFNAAKYAAKYLIEGVPKWNDDFAKTDEAAAPIREGDPVGPPLSSLWTPQDPNPAVDKLTIQALAMSALGKYLTSRPARISILERGIWHVESETRVRGRHTLSLTNAGYGLFSHEAAHPPVRD